MIGKIRNLLFYILGLICFISPTSIAQDLSGSSFRSRADSLYHQFVNIKSRVPLPAGYSISDKKCGFELIYSVKINLDQFNSSQQQTLNKVLLRPTTQVSVVTSTGKFRVHYDTVGTHAIKYSLNELIKAIDSSYEYEVNFLKFPPPPSDNGAGGDNLYDIYVQDVYPLYGYTELETNLGAEKYSSYVVIDNNFQEPDYYTKGIDAARVTAAHELHHAIQLGNYIFRASDTYFYELTSTSMEEFVYDSINDYYAYIPSFFSNTSKVFSNYSGYSQAIWNIFLQKEFGNSILVKQWENMRSYPALLSIKKSIEDAGSTFRNEFSKFYLYNYFTKHRAVPEKYYEEGANYPLVRINYSTDFRPPVKVITGSSQPCAAQYFQVVDSISNVGGKKDTITLIIVNTNVDSALVWSTSPKTSSFTYRIVNSTDDLSYKKISNSLFGRLEVSELQNWKDHFVVNDTSAIVPVMANYSTLSFPMPFYYSKHQLVKILSPFDFGSEAQVNIYSSGMDLIHTERKRVQSFDDKLVFTWNGLDSNNSKLSTGIYFYVISDDVNTVSGKIVILND